MKIRWIFQRFAISVFKVYKVKYILNYLFAMYIFRLFWLSYLRDKLICERDLTVGGVARNFGARGE
jgi:hypothetical protein